MLGVGWQFDGRIARVWSGLRAHASDNGKPSVASSASIVIVSKVHRGPRVRLAIHTTRYRSRTR